MKKLYIAIFTVTFSLVGNTVWANPHVENNAERNSVENNNTASSTYYINAPRFVRPLIEKWISEYRKVDSRANFAIAKTAETKGKSSLNIQLKETSANNDLAKRTIYFAEYAILPVTGKNSEAAKTLAKQELNSKNIKSLFFEKDDFEEPDKTDKKAAAYVVYTGNSSQSISAEFASHYGKDASSFRGKRIVGDDLFLNTAIIKDPQGITFNAIPNIYDLNTRKLKSDLALLPIDVEKSQRSAFAEGATIDDLIRVLEANRGNSIPIERVGFSYQDGDSNITNFIAWILTEGENYNHDFGLLRLDAKLVAQQAKQLSSRLTAQK